MSKLLMVRAREGLVGNVRRTCHVVVVPEDGTLPAFLTACCGVRFTPGSAELVNQISGMPCETCLAKAPVPDPLMLDGPKAGSAERGGYDDRPRP